MTTTLKWVAAGAAVLGVFALAAPAQDALDNGDRVDDLEGRRGSSRSFRIRVPDGADELEIRTSGGRGDVDLYVRHGGEASRYRYDERSEGSDTNEVIRVRRPAEGWWYITLYGYNAYRDVELEAEYEGGDDDGDHDGRDWLRPDRPVRDLSGRRGSRIYFRLRTTPRANVLRLMTRDGRGDSDLYIARGYRPTPDRYDRRSANKDTKETIVVPRPEPGEWWVLVHGYDDFSGVSLVADWEGGAGPPPPPDEDDFRILYPDGGERWRLGRDYVVRWEAPRNVRYLRIEFSLNNGRDWREGELPDRILARLGRFELRVPREDRFVSDDVRLRFIDVDRRRVLAVSERFEIVDRYGDDDDDDDDDGDDDLRRDRYEPDNSRDRTTELRLGREQHHTIYPEDDEDFFRFDPPRREKYLVRFTDMSTPLKCHVWISRNGREERHIEREKIDHGGEYILLDATDERIEYFKFKVVPQDDDDVGEYTLTLYRIRD